MCGPKKKAEFFLPDSTMGKTTKRRQRKAFSGGGHLQLKRLKERADIASDTPEPTVQNRLSLKSAHQCQRASST